MVPTYIPQPCHLQWLLLFGREGSTEFCSVWETAWQVYRSAHWLIPEGTVYPPPYHLQDFPLAVQVYRKLLDKLPHLKLQLLSGIGRLYLLVCMMSVSLLPTDLHCLTFSSDGRSSHSNDLLQSGGTELYTRYCSQHQVQ